MRNLFIASIFVGILLVRVQATAQTPTEGTPESTTATGSRRVVIPRAPRPPTLDDFLSNAPDVAGVLIADFRQREPGDGIPASQKTSAYLSYDDTNLYVVFRCEDEPDKVRARMSKREDISQDDSVTVYLDTFHDGQRAYYFSVNPLGVQADGTMTSGADDRFDTLWYSSGRVTEHGYVVSLTIPFRSLRFSNADSQTWGIALGRSIVRNNENSFWPFISQRESSFIQQMAVAEGLTNISARRNIQFIPYGEFTNAKLLNLTVPRYQTHVEFRGGMDAKVVLHNSLTLDATVNPDFSQVESDDPQVTVNQRFEVFFPEKRPFFLENLNYFETPMNLFFTRRIADPEFGSRVTGKVGRWNLGVLATDDRAPGKIVDVENSLYEKRAFIGVARIQREFGKDSNIGVLATELQFGASENSVFSIDTRLRLSPSWYFTGQTAYSKDRSYNRDFDVVGAKGRARSAGLLRAGRNFNYGASYQDFSDGFRVPLGFVQRVAVRSGSQYAGYYFRPENSKVLSFGPTISVGANWDYRGGIQDKYSNVRFKMDFAGPIGWSVSRYDIEEHYLTQTFRHNTSSASFYAYWMKRFTFYGNASVGKGINYSTPNGMDPFLGSTQDFSTGFSWHPGTRMRFEQYYDFNRFRAPRNFQGAGEKQVAVYANRLARTKVNFQFNKSLSIRGIFDYYFLSPNTELFRSDRYKQLTGDLLLTYLLHPGTALYIGYNNRFENLAVDPAAPPLLRRFGPPTTSTGRQVFVKLSYLLRY